MKAFDLLLLGLGAVVVLRVVNSATAPAAQNVTVASSAPPAQAGQPAPPSSRPPTSMPVYSPPAHSPLPILQPAPSLNDGQSAPTSAAPVTAVPIVARIPYMQLNGAPSPGVRFDSEI